VAAHLLAGVYNGTAPEPVTMGQMCTALGGVMRRPSWLPVPDFAINLLLGEGGQVGWIPEADREGREGRAATCSLLWGWTGAINQAWCLRYVGKPQGRAKLPRGLKRQHDHVMCQW